MTRLPNALFAAAFPIAPVGFTGSPLDRADVLRRDDEELERVRRDPAARYLAFAELKPFLDISATVPQLHWLEWSGIPEEVPWVFLGMLGAVPHFAVSVQPGSIVRGELMEARAAVAAQMTTAEAAILAQARSLLAWHARHPYCSICGSPTRSVKGGYQRVCTADTCRSEHFPRTDPVVIMLVVDGDRCLLARHARLRSGMYSTLAGFVEPGESVEEAVAREVWEEAGVRIGRVRYIASQPWPFPSSLMIGCFAEALSDELHVDTTELDEARWYTREEARAALAGNGPFLCPPPFAIAHTLLRTWAEL